MVSIFEVQLPGYSIKDQIYSGTRTLVYRGIREQDQKPVAIKLMRLEYPSFHELLQFRNQYVIAKNLNLPGAIAPYSLETYHNGYALIMEDFGGISLKEWGIEQRNTQAIANFLQVAIPIADIINQMHSDTCGGLHLRVIHKDIKPANILINPETKQIKLIDFSIASLLPREVQEIQSFNVLEGTLAYLSPEQTGRMNRGVDYRTDLYSLGVTFYEILTGQLPFQSDDPIELVHAHLAKQATPPHQINPDIPLIISEIIAKLMAKNAEERYQSALGLKYDLETCWQSLQQTGEIPVFEIGKRDIQERFIIPEKLYGREQEVHTLLDAFERVANGASELMLIAGFSGIGKTAVVNEVHKPIVKQRGYFIKGKFDQFNRNIPFSAFVQAFRNLMEQLLTEADIVIQHWKTKIITALGENAQVIVEVIPELEMIIGQQPPVPELSGSAAENRFNLLLQKFIQIFTTKDHPLVMFLDDLQWADSASLKLIELLMNDNNNGYLLLIGAYRDNEVIPAHPLMLTLEKITKKNATINTIILQNLSYLKLNQLVADTLGCVEELAWSLSQLIYQKTQGNPFFATQFLKALYQDGLIEFNSLEGYWQCDITQINQQALTDDVVEFMEFQLRKLPQSTQHVLKLAACIGNKFDLKTLAIVSEQSEIETATYLWNALQEGLILPQSDVYKFYIGEVNHAVRQESSEIVAYKFLHDRVQQAAYALIPESDKQLTHLKTGKLILKNTLSEALETSIFDIVSQLNQGIDIITEQSEKRELAQLNLIAGKKAKASTAYKAAVKYFTVGMKLLLDNSWETDYKLTFNLYRERAECEYLVGNFGESEACFDLALNSARDVFDRADIYVLLMALRMTQGENIYASVDAGIKGLSSLGLKLPDTPEEIQALAATELEKLQTNLANVNPRDLFALPEMTDPVQKACMKLLAVLWSASYLAGNQDLAYLISLLMLNISLKYGNSETSSVAYDLYGINLADRGEYQTAYEFGELSLKVAHHFNNLQILPKNINHFGHAINPYIRHLKTNLPLYQQSFQISYDTGNLLYGVWAVIFTIWTMLIKGDRLSDIYLETDKYLNYVEQVNDTNMLYTFILQRKFIASLENLSETKKSFDYENNENISYIDIFQKNNFAIGISWYCILKLQLLYLQADYHEAVQIILEVEKRQATNLGFFPTTQYHFYYPLCLTALYATATPEEKQQYCNLLEKHQQILEKLADNCPENFLHRYLLLSAEIVKISGKGIEAIDLYDRAIALAKANEYLQEEAIANELAAKFYLEWGKDKVAAGYMQEAYYCYARWGALAKVDNLEKLYPQLLQPILLQRKLSLNPLETIANIGLTRSSSSNGTSSSTNNISDVLDFTSILKAAQAISSSIELDRLIVSLTRIILENSGAKKTVLILPQGDSWQVRAITYIDREANSGCEIKTILETQPIETCLDIPKQLIYYVKNTQETVAIDNLQSDISGLMSEYMQLVKPKSALCMPILNQGHLVGILYLENKLTQGVFTSDRRLILNFLCTQAGISLDNAQLYCDLQASKTLLHKLANNIPGVIYQLCLSKDGVASMPYISSGCYQLYGIPAEEFLSENSYQSLRGLEHPEDSAQVEKLIMESAQNLTTFQHEWRIITPTGQLKWIQAVSQPEAQEDGSLVWDGVLLDITERKQAEAIVQQKSQELEQALQNLQQAQLQIVQNEKMSALGNLVAGVAHEINNPVGFINGNIQPAYEGVQDLFNLLDCYQEKFPQPGEEIEAEIENIDLEYLRSDLPKLISSMKEGVHRIREISNSLRTFSRADSDYKVPFNIHDGLDSTILILKHRLKANDSHPAIEIVKNYGNFPQIECFPGQLNQVFMNLLANAIDALEESNIGRSFAEIQANPNIIVITTKLSDDSKQVNISIKDNGMGMTQEVKQKIFDHLYTTKMVGKGTGLGLAIARQIIVEKHGGTLEVNSALNQGAEFIITLPR
ncbi:MAG: AAA family ATPase [Nostoc sp. ChiSLP02]|nr:AAA family ATPase [Nostoc sp. DedSLP05]MDZ8097829.1 AAA family ATPase [Nostoc sp. DedSLP01]MDZ8183914.1 AAA family ATPase [Nostoc sp. ChiSLP02]